jgi:formylglycine-generating enzyme required for sulfatase activity
VEDLLGNVQQWTRSLWGSQPAPPGFGYPYDPDDGREIVDPKKLPAAARVVHRGGSFKSAPADLRCSARGNALPDSKIAWRGFRVVMEV